MITPKITYLSDIQRHILNSLKTREQIAVHGKYIGDVLSLQMQGLITTETTDDGSAIKCRRAVEPPPRNLGAGVSVG